MIDLDSAKEFVLRYLATIPPRDQSGWAIQDAFTREYDIGWLFFWTMKSNLSRKNPVQLAGNVPIFVHKDDGALYSWPMLHPFEQLLEKIRHDRESLYRLDKPQ